ncbi:MAG: hypothetical protein VB085_03870 [Peptococcaceae bacterium]|nr:hypothetical protein [Peptococcaceae bacterium]
MYALVTGLYLVVSFAELASLAKNQQKKEMIYFSALMIISFVISILLLAGVDLPKPNEIIEKIVLGVFEKMK